ncbi:C5AR1 protein, partial [Penelope pileata]|nr:C5AR1 protein [Penelope pileata]
DLGNFTFYDDGGFAVPAGQRAVLALYAAIFLLGVIGNGAVIWVSAAQLRRSVNGVWFLHLSLADLLCCLAIPFLAAPLADDHRWALGAFGCKLLPSLTVLNMFASVLLLAAISADRCALVTRPVWSQTRRSPSWARRVCAALWAAAALLTTPSFVFRSIRHDPVSDKATCVFDYAVAGRHRRFAELFAAILRFLFGFLFPFGAVAACYGLLLARVRTKRFARSRRATVLVLAVIVTFFACWLPFHVVGLLLAACPPHSAVFKGAMAADPAATGIAYLNSCLNPIIYVAAGRGGAG